MVSHDPIKSIKNVRGEGCWSCAIGGWMCLHCSSHFYHISSGKWLVCFGCFYQFLPVYTCKTMGSFTDVCSHFCSCAAMWGAFWGQKHTWDAFWGNATLPFYSGTTPEIETVWCDLSTTRRHVAQPQQSAKNSLFLCLPIFQCHVVQIKCSLNVLMGLGMMFIISMGK